MPFPKPALDGLAFYAKSLEDANKVEAAFLKTVGEGQDSLEEAIITVTKSLYTEVISIRDWAKREQVVLKKRSKQKILMAILLTWARIRGRWSR